MKTLCAFVVALLASSSVFAAWDLNDVSYLMPLPAQIGSDNLLGIEAPGRGGALLPPQLLDTVPVLSGTMTQSQINESLRVIAVRIDPCFPLPTPQACQRQLRIVWQPLEAGRRGGITQTVDAALHSFYVLSENDFVKVLQDIKAWKAKYGINTAGLPLQVHPAWAQQGDQSPALVDFNSIIKKYAGFQNLSRVTVMALRGAGDMWLFQGFDVINGRLNLLRIARTDRAAQAFVNQAVPADHFERGMIAPVPAGDDTVNKLIVDSSRLEQSNEDIIRKDVRGAYRIENPKNYSPETMDCASCHAAQPAREWAQRKRSDIFTGDLWQNFAYQNPRYNLTNTTQILGNTQNLRAFGYFIDDVAISQRVINESAEVADVVNQYFSSQK